MNFNSTTVSYPVYYMIDFYDRFRNAIASSELTHKDVQLAQAFATRMISEADPMETIEELATVHAATEFTIFLSDLVERLSAEEATILEESKQDLISDFVELYSLITEEEGFSEGLSGFAGSEIEQNNDNHEESEKKEEKAETPLPEEEAQVDLLPYPAAYYTVLTEQVKTDGLRVDLLAALLGQLDRKGEILEKLIPSELSNIIQLMDESYSAAGLNVYTNAELIESNVNALEDKYVSDLRAANYDILSAAEVEAEIASENLPDFKVSQIESSESKDPVVRSQLKDYFRNEIKEQSLEFKEIVSSINVHSLIPNKFEQLQASFSSLKDMCMIHGYDGLELVAEELISLMNEGINDSLVFTNNSKHALLSVFDAFNLLIDASDSNDEQDVVNQTILKLNTFNESLAIIEVTDTLVFKKSDAEVLTELKKIVKTKINLLTASSNFSHLSEDFSFLELPIQAEFSSRISTAPASLRTVRLDEIRVMLTNDILQEDIELFFGNENEELVEETKAAQTLSFADVQDRPQIYLSILLKKVETLKELFEQKDPEKITVFSAELEQESAAFGAINFSELVNFYSLNLDAYLNKADHIISELDRFKESPESYRFEAEKFSSEQEEENKSLLDNHKTEDDEWIKGVADVLENTSDNNSEIISEKINIKPLFNDVDDDIREIFTEEAASYIEAIQKQLDLLSANPKEKEAIVMAEKAAHTLKGAAMMLSIETVGSIAEKIERICEREAEQKNGIDSKKIKDLTVFLESIKDLIAGNVESAEERLKSVTSSPSKNDELDEEELDHDTEMLEIFQEESSEHVEQIDLALTEAMNDLENVQRFRQVESDSLSLKSAAKMLGFKNIGDLAEQIELSAEKIVKEERTLNAAALSAMRSILHAIKELSLGHSIKEEELNEALEVLSSERSKDSEPEDEPSSSDLFIEESIDVITKISETFDRLKSSPDQSDNLTKLEQMYFQLGSAASAATYSTIAKHCQKSEHLIQALIADKKPVPTAALSLLQRSIADLIKSSKLIEETQTDLSPSTESLLLDIENYLSPKKADENLSTITEDTSDTIKLRSQLSNKLDSLNALIADLQNSDDEKTDRKVVLKNLDDIKSQVEHLQGSIETMTQAVETNTEKAKNLSEEKVSSTEKTACHVFRINGEFYGIRSQIVQAKSFISKADGMIVDGENHILINDENHTLRSLADLLGLSDPLPDQVDVLSYSIGNSFIALTAPIYIGELNLELQELSSELKRNACDASAFTENKELVFIITESFLAQKLYPSKSSNEKNETKVSKVKKKTVSQQNTTALIADDSVSIRRFMEEILSNIGFNTITATDGDDALTKFKENNVDVLITDIEMPHKDGYELIQEIRRDSSYDAIPLMVLTGRSSEKDKEEALAKGANSYILKPFKEMELRQKLSEFFNFKKG
jgi:CheY-like chemotaxis protein/HPt (histidine-containing phosphotransfer) domain-containing protein